MLLLLSRRAEPRPNPRPVTPKRNFLLKIQIHHGINIKTVRKTNTIRQNLQNSQESDSQTAQVPKICFVAARSPISQNLPNFVGTQNLSRLRVRLLGCFGGLAAWCWF